MSVSSRALIDLVLLGPTNDRRQLQDSPILGDVWIAFATKPAMPMDLLITPWRELPATRVAREIAQRINKDLRHEEVQEAQVAYLEGIVVARLFFQEVIRVILPMTEWWQDPKNQEILRAYNNNWEKLSQIIEAIIEWAHAPDEDSQAELAESLANFRALDRYVALAGLILQAAEEAKKGQTSSGGVGGFLTTLERPDEVVKEVRSLIKEILEKPLSDKPWIFQVSLNRKAMPALKMSVGAVKGDAARSLFNVRCDKITWAVIDSGIDGGHPAFKDKNGNSRIVKTLDFTNFRKIISLDNLDSNSPGFDQRLEQLRANLKNKLNKTDAKKNLRKLAKDFNDERPVNWELVEKFIEIDPKTEPTGDHGTHVAGIIGANRGVTKATANGTNESLDETDADSENANGMCPDIQLYDLRVLSRSLLESEFAIIAALQYIRYLNARYNYISIHGANLSLSLPHDVRNFACGRTPICIECERLVDSGVVVVAAAGNFGYRTIETPGGSFESYSALSITDPGNADGVITVGATHRYRPHTYGVSFFSSRGPTGDGRLKPDLVAPGERIESCLPNGRWGELDGTSMAAPHVSGAAAMLMARYVELIGNPRRIKRILCESATELGRERNFQGHGMLDVLRAFQSL
jgi:serine protease AprX